MKKEKIIELLKDYQPEQVEKFAAYIVGLTVKRKKDGTLENPWINGRTEEEMAIIFKRVAEDGLVFDGKHITLQSTGISYDYVAYKNKMLLAYPESKLDVGLVYENDVFEVAKEAGSVIYTHTIKNPFNQTPEKMQGGYCIISNKRGDFLTLLSKEDINKHRKVAKQDYIWREWFNEMALKTVIKKACKQHFADIYETIEEKDNENYSLENPLDLDLKHKQEIEAIKTVEELKAYYEKNKGRGKGFDSYVSTRMAQLNQNK
jgi:hypothetical protein